jgi:hypothetical protein
MSRRDKDPNLDQAIIEVTGRSPILKAYLETDLLRWNRIRWYEGVFAASEALIGEISNQLGSEVTEVALSTNAEQFISRGFLKEGINPNVEALLSRAPLLIGYDVGNIAVSDLFLPDIASGLVDSRNIRQNKIGEFRPNKSGVMAVRALICAGVKLKSISEVSSKNHQADKKVEKSEISSLLPQLSLESVQFLQDL